MAEDVDANYAKAYAGSAGFGTSPALLLVDFVQAYFDPDGDLFSDPGNALHSAREWRHLNRF